MSRSTRAPYYTDQQRGRTGRVAQAKRQAARAVRASAKGQEAPANGSAYKRESCSWNIRDWSFHCPNDPKARRK